MFVAALFIITKVWKQTKCSSVDEWTKQLWDIYTMEFYLAIKKKKNYPLSKTILKLRTRLLIHAFKMIVHIHTVLEVTFMKQDTFQHFWGVRVGIFVKSTHVCLGK